MGMSHKESSLLNEAVAGLKLTDLVLLRSSFERPADTEGTESESRLGREEVAVDGEQEFMCGVHAQDGPDGKTKQVLVSLGIRLVIPKSEPAIVLVVIEATFGVEYTLLAEVSDEAMRLFARRNAVHNVWPFWRQHVFDVVQRGHLPKLEVPLYSMKNAQLSDEVEED